MPSPRPLGPAVRLLPQRRTISIGTPTHGPRGGTLELLACQHQIPVFAVRRPMGSALRSTLMAVEPDLVVVSCFPWLLPPDIVDVASIAAINLHPSLLPGFRGPDPLFWALQTGAREWGVSVHALTNSFDSGPVYGQIDFPINSDVSDLETRVSTLGADLLVDVVGRLQTDDLQPVCQDDRRASYYGFPGQEDLLIQRTWTVSHALGFVSGIQPLGYTARIQTDRGTFDVVSAERGRFGSGGCVSGLTWVEPQVIRLPLSDGEIELHLGELSADI